MKRSEFLKVRPAVRPPRPTASCGRCPVPGADRRRTRPSSRPARRRMAFCTRASANGTYTPELTSTTVPPDFASSLLTAIQYYYSTACLCCEEFVQSAKHIWLSDRYEKTALFSESGLSSSKSFSLRLQCSRPEW